MKAECNPELGRTMGYLPHGDFLLERVVSVRVASGRQGVSKVGANPTERQPIGTEVNAGGQE
jgi:hypothetical protein